MISRTVDGILLDIEGTTSSIAFVYDVMFPYVRTHLREFLERDGEREEVRSAIDQIAIDAGLTNGQTWLCQSPGHQAHQEVSPSNIQSSLGWVVEHVHGLMDVDSKATGLKALQGLIWQAGFSSQELKSHLFPDVVPAIELWRSFGIAVAIYSSGSIVAQKLFFGHTPLGDLQPYFDRFYDTTIGPKKLSDSYGRIAVDYGFPPDRILFLSDVAAELEAARQAGMQIAAVVRPGNHPLPADYDGPRIESFEELNILGSKGCWPEGDLL